MNFRQFYRCMCRNRSGIAPGAGCFAGCSRLRIRIAGWNYGRGNACVLFARYGEGGTEVVGPIFFGNDRILGLLRFLLKDGEGIIV